MERLFGKRPPTKMDINSAKAIWDNAQATTAACRGVDPEFIVRDPHVAKAAALLGTYHPSSPEAQEDFQDSLTPNLPTPGRYWWQ